MKVTHMTSKIMYIVPMLRELTSLSQIITYGTPSHFCVFETLDLVTEGVSLVADPVLLAFWIRP